jgi:hypothetical protein
MIETSLSELCRAVEAMHACAVTLASREVITEEVENSAALYVVVHVFELLGQPRTALTEDSHAQPSKTSR